MGLFGKKSGTPAPTGSGVVIPSYPMPVSSPPPPPPGSTATAEEEDPTPKAPEQIRWNEWNVLELREALEDALTGNFNRTFFIWGPPAVGKCLPGDELVLDATTGAYVPIRDFDLSHEVAAFVNGELIKVRPSAKMENGRRPVVKVRTQTGRELRATKNHPFLALVEGSKGKYTDLKWVVAGQLLPGTKVAVAFSQPFFGSEELPEDEVKLLALLDSEGSLKDGFGGTKRAMFTNSSPVLLQEFEGAATRLGFEVRIDHEQVNEKTSVLSKTLAICRPKTTGFVALMEKGADGLRFETSGRKEIPQIVFRLCREQVCLFLRYLYSGDGWVEGYENTTVKGKRQPRIEYSSKSKKLIRQVQELLAKFGIVSSVNWVVIKGETYYALSINAAREVLSFLDQIGFVGHDPIRIERAREAARQIVENLDERQKGNRIFRFGLLFDPVEEVLPDGEDETFDLSVPVAHNFVAAGMVVHNSAVVKQACGNTKRKLIDDRLSQKDPTDVRGVLCPGPDGKAQWLITPEYGPLWTGETPVCLFYDEHNHAPDILQKASYEISWDHSIGGQPFKKEVVVILAGNREIDNANITPMDKPMQSRVIHVYVRFDSKVFLDYADREGAFHPLVTAYLHDRPDKAYAPAGDAKEYYGDPLPRTWEMTSDVLRGFKEKYWDKLIAGCIGPGEAIEFTAWAKAVGTLRGLIDDVASGANIFAKEMSQQYFVCQSLVDRFRRDKSLARRVLQYAVAMKKKFPEIGGVMMNQAYFVDSDVLMANKSEWKEAIAEYGKLLT